MCKLPAKNKIINNRLHHAVVQKKFNRIVADLATIV